MSQRVSKQLVTPSIENTPPIIPSSCYDNSFTDSAISLQLGVKQKERSMSFSSDEEDIGYESEAGSIDLSETFGADDPVLSFPVEKQKRKPYEVECTSFDADTLVQRHHNEAEQVASILGIDLTYAQLLLRFYKWNKEAALEKYMEEPEQVMRKAGLPKNPSIPTQIITKAFECPICVESGQLQTLSLGCGHTYCVTCNQRYIDVKIREENECRRIECPADQCGLIFDDKTIRLLSDNSLWKIYKNLSLKADIETFNHIRWCPGVDCTNVVECSVDLKSLSCIVPTVKCLADHSFCFGCLLPDHQPCTCAFAKLWLSKCQDDSETSNWMSANTKDCPKCGSTTEKNGGYCVGNHMTCKSCKHEYCWLCIGPWSEHGTSYFHCNRYDEKSSKEARTQITNSRKLLERWLHYYNRYANHQTSAKLDEKTYHKIEKKMEEMQTTSDLSWIQVQFLRTAVDELIKCRMTLKWTYAFAYYLVQDNATHLFENNQMDLEMAVEQLSGLLEKPIVAEHIPQLKQETLDKTVYVQTRREVLLTDVAIGLTENRWQYNVDLNKS